MLNDFLWLFMYLKHMFIGMIYVLMFHDNKLYL